MTRLDRPLKTGEPIDNSARARAERMALYHRKELEAQLNAITRKPPEHQVSAGPKKRKKGGPQKLDDKIRDLRIAKEAGYSATPEEVEDHWEDRMAA